MNTSVHTYEIRPYNTKELAHIYRVQPRIFRKWLQPHLSCLGERTSRYFTALQVKLIFEKLGLPGPVSE